MTDVQFPHLLGHPKRESIQYQPENNNDAFVPRLGAPLTQRRGPAGAFMTASWYWTQEELLSFDLWWKGEAQEGQAVFVMRDPVMGDFGRWMFQPETTPSYGRPAGSRYAVTLQLYRLPS